MIFTNKEQQMIEFYRTAVKDGKKPQMQELEKQFGIDRNQCSKVLDQAGLRQRETRPRGTANRFVICHHCGAKMMMQGAKYCCFCGQDIRSKEDIVCESLIALSNRLFTQLTNEEHRLLQDVYDLIKK